jgi:hypothetical protein
MFRPLTILFLFVLCGAPALYAQTPVTPDSQPGRQEEPHTPPEATPEATPVMNEYRGVKLGMNLEEVKKVIGKTARAGEGWSEFKMDDDDLMTVHYDDQGLVKTIQLYFTDPARAPKWNEVVGHAEIQEKPTGSKFARAENKEKDFWVTMFQSKSGEVTTITLSR